MELCNNEIHMQEDYMDGTLMSTLVAQRWSVLEFSVKKA